MTYPPTDPRAALPGALRLVRFNDRHPPVPGRRSRSIGSSRQSIRSTSTARRCATPRAPGGCRFATTKLARFTGGCSSWPTRCNGAPNDPVRPLTFLWNGGPGSSSSLVHLLGFGPRRIAPPTPVGPSPAKADRSTIRAPGSISPIWCSSIRSAPVIAVRSAAEYGAEFYQTRGDEESVAEFIRVYRNRFDAHDCAARSRRGELRSDARRRCRRRARTARHTCSRAILIGLALPLGNLTPEQRIALNVPTYTATAFANKKLARGSANRSADRHYARPKRGRPPDMRRRWRGAMHSAKPSARR